MQQIYRRTPMPKYDLLKSHFGMGVLQKIIFGTPFTKDTFGWTAASENLSKQKFKFGIRIF